MSFYCQSNIEDNGRCEIQCDHCKEYYKPLEEMKDIKRLAHEFLIKKGCKSIAQPYIALTVEEYLVEFLQDYLKNIE